MILILKYGKNETGGVEHIPPGYNRWGKIIQYEIRNEYLFLIWNKLNLFWLDLIKWD